MYHIIVKDNLPGPGKYNPALEVQHNTQEKIGTFLSTVKKMIGFLFSTVLLTFRLEIKGPKIF